MTLVIDIAILKVLAALDVHTARWIVEKCFQGDLIRGRTVLLVVSHTFSTRLYYRSSFQMSQTHNVAMAGPLADYVVSLGQDGRIACRGTVSDALKKDKTLAKDVAKGARALKDDEKRIDAEEPDEVAKPGDGKLILSEEIAEGHVSWDAGERLFFRISDCWVSLMYPQLSCLLKVWEDRTQSCFGYYLLAAWYFATPF